MYMILHTAWLTPDIRIALHQISIHPVLIRDANNVPTDYYVVKVDGRERVKNILPGYKALSKEQLSDMIPSVIDGSIVPADYYQQLL